MGVFDFISGRKKQAPGQLAKERLKVVLVQDRIKLSPELLELIKADLLTAISRRLEVDEQNVQISMARENRWDRLQADMPIKRQKVSFEWDPPAHTTAANVLRGKVRRGRGGEGRTRAFVSIPKDLPTQHSLGER